MLTKKQLSKNGSLKTLAKIANNVNKIKKHYKVKKSVKESINYPKVVPNVMLKA